jgi:hypothetical protein
MCVVETQHAASLKGYPTSKMNSNSIWKRIGDKDKKLLRYYTWLVRIPFLFSALWSIGVGLYLLLTPQTIVEQVAVSTPGSTETSEEIVRQVSWYQVQGLWGVIVLVVVFTQRMIAAAITSLLAVGLVYLAGLSIGPLYLPALLGVVVGWAFLGFARLTGERKEKP